MTGTILSCNCSASAHRWVRRALPALLVLLTASAGVSAQSVQIAPEASAARRPLAGLSLSNRPADSTAGLEPGLDAAPVRYDARDVGGQSYVSSVKNQGALGSCWTFATYASMESGLMQAGGPEQDYSENHLVRNHGFYWGPNDGGHIWMSQAYLARLAGPVAEADDPYSDASSAPSPGGARQRTFSGLVYEEDPAAIKDALMTHGALHTSMCWDSAAYRSSDQTYYYAGAASTNHAVTLVGWDDTKTTAAANPGAWLVKNSWGEGFGDGGYFWMSYDDTKAASYAAAFTSAPASKVTGVYTHSDFGDVVEINTPFGANVFQTGSQAETLGAVGLYAQYWDEDYVIEVYDTLAGGQASGLLLRQTGTADSPGFQMIDLASEIELGADDDFVVVVGFPNSPVQYMSAMDYDSFAEEGWHYSDGSTASPGESFFSFDGSNWSDLTAIWPTANFAINAYTVPEPASMGLLFLGGLAMLRRRRSGA